MSLVSRVSRSARTPVFKNFVKANFGDHAKKASGAKDHHDDHSHDDHEEHVHLVCILD